MASSFAISSAEDDLHWNNRDRCVYYTYSCAGIYINVIILSILLRRIIYICMSVICALYYRLLLRYDPLCYFTFIYRARRQINARTHFASRASEFHSLVAVIYCLIIYLVSLIYALSSIFVPNWRRNSHFDEI